MCSGGSSTPPTPMCLFSSGTSLEHPAWPEPRRAERVLFFSRTVGATTRVGGSSRKEEPHGEEPSGWVSHGSCVRRVSYPGSVGFDSPTGTDPRTTGQIPACVRTVLRSTPRRHLERQIYPQTVANPSAQRHSPAVPPNTGAAGLPADSVWLGCVAAPKNLIRTRAAYSSRVERRNKADS